VGKISFFFLRLTSAAGLFPKHPRKKNRIHVTATVSSKQNVCSRRLHIQNTFKSRRILSQTRSRQKLVSVSTRGHRVSCTALYGFVPQAFPFSTKVLHANCRKNTRALRRIRILPSFARENTTHRGPGTIAVNFTGKMYPLRNRRVRQKSPAPPELCEIFPAQPQKRKLFSKKNGRIALFDPHQAAQIPQKIWFRTYTGFSAVCGIAANFPAAPRQTGSSASRTAVRVQNVGISRRNFFPA